jgi:dTMP kinase
MRGTFISLEGGEGVGKSTQIDRLASTLRSHGIEVITTREPGGTEGAEAIRHLLMTGTQDRWNAQTEALLFAAARADHVAKLIKPALERGAWVLCDRFIDSTRAYQGGAGGVTEADIMDLHRVGSAGLMPDRTVLLELNTAEGAARAQARDAVSDRMGARSSDYFDRVAKRFRDIASEDSNRFRIVDANGSIDEVSARIIAVIQDMLPAQS